jgi:hypothetical protein
MYVETDTITKVRYNKFEVKRNSRITWQGFDPTIGGRSDYPLCHATNNVQQMYLHT